MTELCFSVLFIFYFLKVAPIDIFSFPQKGKYGPFGDILLFCAIMLEKNKIKNLM